MRGRHRRGPVGEPREAVDLRHGQGLARWSLGAIVAHRPRRLRLLVAGVAGHPVRGHRRGGAPAHGPPLPPAAAGAPRPPPGRRRGAAPAGPARRAVRAQDRGRRRRRAPASRSRSCGRPTPRRCARSCSPLPRGCSARPAGPAHRPRRPAGRPGAGRRRRRAGPRLPFDAAPEREVYELPMPPAGRRDPAFRRRAGARAAGGRPRHRGHLSGDVGAVFVCCPALFGGAGVRLEPHQPGRQLPGGHLARRHPAAARPDRDPRPDGAAGPRAGHPAEAGPALARQGLVAGRDQRRRVRPGQRAAAGHRAAPGGHAGRGDDRALARAARPGRRRPGGAASTPPCDGPATTAASRVPRAARAGSTRSGGAGTASASPSARW